MVIGIISGAILLFLAIGIYHANRLRTIEIIRSVDIRAGQDEVYGMISLLGNYPKWSPFLAQDPTMRYEVKGTDGTVGASYHWEGNKDKDLGQQEIVKLEPYRFVGIQVQIEKPFKAGPTFEYTIKNTGEKTEVIQRFELRSGLVDAFFMWLFGVKKEMENTNQQGLELLKKASEG